ncbi:MAG: DUF1015 family protein [Clostridiales bacterium]|nr:DUF1015 family protein [Clostridiales bacterium]
MTNIFGLTGLRPGEGWAKQVTCPPYDVIKPGSPLEAILKGNHDSLYHVTLGSSPAAALAGLIQRGVLIEDQEPGFYVYEQRFGADRRVGFLAAPEVTPYEARQIIRHEKTFDDKVAGRIRLMEETGYVTEPIWLLAEASLGALLDAICAGADPVYAFSSDFQGHSELSGIENTVYKVAEGSSQGQALVSLIAQRPLYIADGHHRYHSALHMGLDRCIAYICPADQIRIQAYNRVIRSEKPFASVRDSLALTPSEVFHTPARHAFILYARDGCWQYSAGQVDESDVRKRLDCSILEETLYQHLGLTDDMLMDTRYFDYYPEQDLDLMRKAVDEGEYDLAVALHPVSLEELLAVADAGLLDPDTVMPEKSTFFLPKILSGLFLQRTTKAPC